MQTVELICHPDSASQPCTGLRVTLSLSAGHLSLLYSVSGVDARLRWPERGRGERQDELWRHTCFEAFIKQAGESAYYEFNFAPSSAWAAYKFSGYRQGQNNLALAEPPLIETELHDTCFELRTVVGIADLPGLHDASDLRLGLSAVLETESGHCTHWALRHPAERADFHHAAGFALLIPRVP
jgi:hypothetical protein